jgi:excisionase family DNA binding protein
VSDLLTVHEVAAELRVHEATVRRWIEAGDLRAQRLGKRSIRIGRIELDRFIAASGTQPEPINGTAPSAAHTEAA